MNANMRKLATAVIAVFGASYGAASIANTNPERTTAQQPSQARVASAAGGDIRVSKLIGKEVQARDGTKLGEIEDLVIDMRDGSVAFAVLDQEDPQRAGEPMVAIPMQQMRARLNGDRIVADTTRSGLAGFTSFGGDAWPEWDHLARTGTKDRTTAAGNKFRRASQLLDAELRDRGGRDVGDIEDFVVNLQSGKLAYGVAEFDTSWIKPGKLVVVQMTDIQPSVDGRDLVLRVDRDRMSRAPAFERDRWPDVNEEGFRAQLAQYADKAEGVVERVEDRITR